MSLSSAERDPFRVTTLPTLADYLEHVAPPEHRAALWAWVASLSPAQRRSAHVVDLEFAPGPQGYVGEEWVPTAEHPSFSVWVVKRCPWLR